MRLTHDDTCGSVEVVVSAGEDLHLACPTPTEQADSRRAEAASRATLPGPLMLVTAGLGARSSVRAGASSPGRQQDDRAPQAGLAGEDQAEAQLAKLDE